MTTIHKIIHDHDVCWQFVYFVMDHYSVQFWQRMILALFCIVVEAGLSFTELSPSSMFVHAIENGYEECASKPSKVLQKLKHCHSTFGKACVFDSFFIYVMLSNNYSSVLISFSKVDGNTKIYLFNFIIICYHQIFFQIIEELLTASNDSPG